MASARMYMLVMATVLHGCARGSEVTEFTPVGSPSFEREAEAAVEEWASVCGLPLLVSPSGIPILELEVVTSVTGVTAGGTWRDSDGEVMRIEIGSSGQDRYGTILHELGHALGAGHAETGIMKSPHTPGARITKEDCGHLVK